MRKPLGPRSREDDGQEMRDEAGTPPSWGYPRVARMGMEVHGAAVRLHPTA